MTEEAKLEDSTDLSEVEKESPPVHQRESIKVKAKQGRTEDSPKQEKMAPSSESIKVKAKQGRTEDSPKQEKMAPSDSSSKLKSVDEVQRGGGLDLAALLSSSSEDDDDLDLNL